MLFPIAIPPGLYANGTYRESKGRWREGNLVRWIGRAIRPVLGWIEKSTTTMTGKCRSMLAFTDDNNQRWLIAGTHNKLYVMSPGGVLSDITPSGFVAGSEGATLTGGYGMGLYGDGTYGTPRTSTAATIQPASVWTLDLFDQTPLACAGGHDGKIYEWGRNTGVAATAVTNAPTDCEGVGVTTEGFVFALKERNVQWSDQGNRTVWTPSATNQAGDLDLQTRGILVCTRNIRGGTIIFSTVDAFLAQYQGPPTVYGFSRIGDDCGIAGVSAVVSTDNFAVWMGTGSFFIFYGQAVQTLPCEVQDAVFHDGATGLNRGQASKVSAWHNPANSEIWWHYPSNVTTENDRYVSWNYRDNTWMTGQLDRLAGVGPGTFERPLLVNGSGRVYEHETGFDYGSYTPYIRSGPFEIGTGEQRMLVRQVVADEDTLGDVDVTFHSREWPTGSETTTTVTAAEPSDVLFAAREVEIKLTGSSLSDWRIGEFRVDAVPVSKR